MQMQPSINSTTTAQIKVRSAQTIVSQRRCFLIDSLLEERQKKLAASVAAKREANGFNPEECEREKEVGKETTMPDLHMEDKETINDQKNKAADNEETANEEVLPTFDEDKETDKTVQTNHSDQLMGQEEAGSDRKQRRALLEALVKLEPVAMRQAEETEREADGEAESVEEGGETALSSTTVSAEFLHKFRLFQQQLASTAAFSGGWPLISTNHSPIPTNFVRLPFAPFSFLINNSNNQPPKSFASNSWRPSMPSISMPSVAKRRVKAMNGKVGNEAQTIRSIDASQGNFLPAWAAPTFLNVPNVPNGSVTAMLASIGAFRAAAAAAVVSASMHNDGTNLNRNSPVPSRPDERELRGAKLPNNSGRSARRPSTSAQQRQQQRHLLPHGRIGRSSNAKKYRCDICDKTFSRSNTLITHKRIHTGEKPFRCEHCGRAFRQPGNLTRHAYTHTTVKPFVCAECGKAFNRASNLQSHVRVHAAGSGKSGENSGGATRQCKQCQNHFETRAEFRAHRCS